MCMLKNYLYSRSNPSQIQTKHKAELLQISYLKFVLFFFFFLKMLMLDYLKQNSSQIHLFPFAVNPNFFNQYSSKKFFFNQHFYFEVLLGNIVGWIKLTRESSVCDSITNTIKWCLVKLRFPPWFRFRVLSMEDYVVFLNCRLFY
jgi:hypothetical protein